MNELREALEEADRDVLGCAEKGGDFIDGAEWALGRWRSVLPAPADEEERPYDPGPLCRRCSHIERAHPYCCTGGAGHSFEPPDAASAPPASPDPGLLREALRDIRSTVFRAKQLAATPGRRAEAQQWLGDALNRADRALERAALAAPSEVDTGRYSDD